MKIVAVISPKGGVGKTTTALGLCQCASAAGLRTLLVDYDNQANATASLVHLDDTLNRDNAYDLVSASRQVEPMVITPTLSLIPAANQLMQLDKDDFDIYFRLKERLSAGFSTAYDLVVIDTPGNLGTRVISAMVSAHAIYIPLELTKYSLQALEDTLDLYRRVKNRFNHDLTLLGFLANRVAGLSVETGLPTVTAERKIYAALLAKFTSEQVLGLIAQRRGIKDTLSVGGTIQEIHSDESGKRAQDELLHFANAVLRNMNLLTPAAVG